MPKKSVKVTTQTITSQYGIIEASDAPQEFDADFAGHLVSIGNAEEVADTAGVKPHLNKMDSEPVKEGATVTDISDQAPSQKKGKARKK